MQCFEAAAIQVDEVNILLEVFGKQMCVKHSQDPRYALNNLHAINLRCIRQTVREALGLAFETEIILLCGPPTGLQVRLPQRQTSSDELRKVLSGSVNHKTHTLDMHAMVRSAPALEGLPTTRRAQVWQGAFASEPPDGEEPASEEKEEQVWAEIIQHLPHQHDVDKKKCKRAKRSYPTSKDQCGYQLLYSAEAQCLECIEYLIDHNVDINYQSQSVGYTALDFASWLKPDGQVAKWLVQHGATSEVKAK